MIDDRLALGIESGGTGTRWCLGDGAGRTIAEGIAAPLNGHIFTEADRTRAAAVLDAVRDAVTRHGSPSLILAAMTGLGPSAGPLEFLREGLSRRFGLVPDAIRIEDDMWLAYRGQFAPGEGIVVYAGTGSFAYHITADGSVVRAGGHGILIDDAGGGAWIGLEALRAVLRREDEVPGSGWGSPLGRHLGAVIGGQSWDAARPFVYGGDRGSLGSLGPAVAKAAAEGDETAAELLVRAGAELARLAATVRGRVGDKPVVLLGRAAMLDPRIGATFMNLVTPPVRLAATPPSAATAARLAFEL